MHTPLVAPYCHIYTHTICGSLLPYTHHLWLHTVIHTPFVAPYCHTHIHHWWLHTVLHVSLVALYCHRNKSLWFHTVIHVPLVAPYCHTHKPLVAPYCHTHKPLVAPQYRQVFLHFQKEGRAQNMIDWCLSGHHEALASWSCPVSREYC